MRANTRSEVAEKSSASTAHDVAALVIVADDGTCTVAWGRGWCVWEGMPGVWGSPQEAMLAVRRVVGRAVIWSQTEPRLWEGRL